MQMVVFWAVDAVSTCKWVPHFQRNTLPPSLRLKPPQTQHHSNPIRPSSLNDFLKKWLIIQNISICLKVLIQLRSNIFLYNIYLKKYKQNSTFLYSTVWWLISTGGGYFIPYCYTQHYTWMLLYVHEHLSNHF
jgi:hypothetical protein